MENFVTFENLFLFADLVVSLITLVCICQNKKK